MTKKIIIGFSVAVFVRLVLMVSAMHDDLIFIHYFPYFLSYRGVWDIYGFFGDFFLKQGFTYYAPLVYYVMAFFQFCLKFANPDFSALMDRVHAVTVLYGAAPSDAMLYSFSFPQRLWLLFMMKLPYAFLDVGVGVAIFKFFKRDECGTKQVLRWMLHPVVLFSIYLFGQYRNLTVLLVWSLCLCLKEKRMSLACVLMGALCLSETFPIFLIIPFFVIYSQSGRQALLYLALMLLPAAIILLPLIVSSKGYVLACYYSPVMMKMANQSIFLNYPTIVAKVCKGVLALACLLLYFQLFRRRLGKDWLGHKTAFDLFCYASLYSLLFLYATSTCHIHYFMWAMPFLFIADAQKLPWRGFLLTALLIFLFLCNLNSQTVGYDLITSIKPERYTLLTEWITKIAKALPWGKVVAFSRLSFSVLCVFFAVRLYRRRLFAPRQP